MLAEPGAAAENWPADAIGGTNGVSVSTDLCFGFVGVVLDLAFELAVVVAEREASPPKALEAERFMPFAAQGNAYLATKKKATPACNCQLGVRRVQYINVT